ncbi:hypothetical protein FY528_10365 [Hymenobacter lutimineralis]|uniref:Uncharacterized protein n=1 Tax=Hymenobacter lutimineralis TaxID=2606448 RepID=A0A5D6V3F2_9BACT|nr:MULTISPECIES: hypothetical protein [Hymenobacter]QIX60999.1 hypothetical protein HER32_07305 [Hymenobacter sp. BT18]TYZ09635.1 hypothetical protein FY528_10365 [Hymenobacter lutimineralis]
MEASAYYAQFQRNLDIILDALQAGLDLRTTALEVSLPLEIYVLCEVLNQGGGQFRLSTDGLARVAEFQQQYQQQESATEAIMRRLLEDKKAMMRTPEGRVLTKEMLIRRLEFFNEAARQVNVMRTQSSLGSPAQNRSGVGVAKFQK